MLTLSRGQPVQETTSLDKCGDIRKMATPSTAVTSIMVNSIPNQKINNSHRGTNRTNQAAMAPSPSTQIHSCQIKVTLNVNASQTIGYKVISEARAQSLVEDKLARETACKMMEDNLDKIPFLCIFRQTLLATLIKKLNASLHQPQVLNSFVTRNNGSEFLREVAMAISSHILEQLSAEPHLMNEKKAYALGTMVGEKAFSILLSFDPSKQSNYKKFTAEKLMESGILAEYIKAERSFSYSTLVSPTSKEFSSKNQSPRLLTWGYDKYRETTDVSSPESSVIASSGTQVNGIVLPLPSLATASKDLPKKKKWYHFCC